MQPQSNRRAFLKSTTLAAAGGLALARSAHAAGSDVLKIGLIGCGNRGTGAVGNALGAHGQNRLVAMADAFPDRLEGSLKLLKEKFPEQVAVDAEQRFVGFDAYKQLLAGAVDVVILATPPHFRPIHLAAAVAAGKHVFCEKPVAVDAAGIRSVLATCEEADRRKLNIVSGLCWRYDPGVRETMQRVWDGQIGQIVAIEETYNTGTLWQRPRQPEWTEMEFQMRNWYYFTWLSGDHNVEQHVHSLDKAAWAMHDQPPLRAWGLGGRQVRTEAKFGNIFDHHAVCYEYENGVRLFSYCRQMAGCYNETKDLVFGSKGWADITGGRIEGEKSWQFPRSKSKSKSEKHRRSMFDLEHQALFGAIREGKTINNGLYMSRSTMLAILGRMATYSGKAILWNDAIQSKLAMVPSAYAMDGTPPILPDKDGRYPIPAPGITKVV